MEVSKYETIAQEYLDEHPLGTATSAAALQKWVAQNPDGALLKADLAIPEPSKRLNALRRHLNEGGRSDNIAEDRRFVLQVDDPKLKTLVIQSYADAVHAQVKNAIGKTVNGALSPLKSAKKAAASVKLEELPELERKAHEVARENVLAMEAAVKPTLAQEVDRVWVAEMSRYGISEDQARKIRAALPNVTRLQKLLRATS